MRQELRPEPGGRRESGALEADVMALLWASPEPMSVSALQAGLGGDLAYKTVLTVLIRLHDKGLVDRERAGRAHLYTPRPAPAEAAAQQMTTALSRGADRGQVLQRFLDTLDAAEQAELRNLLDSREQRREE